MQEGAGESITNSGISNFSRGSLGIIGSSGQGSPKGDVSSNLRHYPDRGQIAGRQGSSGDHRRLLLGAGVRLKKYRFGCPGRSRANAIRRIVRSHSRLKRECRLFPWPASNLPMLTKSRSCAADGFCLRPFKDDVGFVADGALDADAADVVAGSARRRWSRHHIRASPCGSPAHETGRRAAGLCGGGGCAARLLHSRSQRTDNHPDHRPEPKR
jgi:hypothetical protein